jgi:nitrogen fixation NifU-like protein
VPALSHRLDEHFRRPRYCGAPPQEAFSGRGENAACGDLVVISVAPDAEGRTRASFQARACSASIACASLVVEAVHDLTLAEALRFDVAALVRRAGGLPHFRRHAVEVVARALEQAVASAERGCHPSRSPSHRTSEASCSDS